MLIDKQSIFNCLPLLFSDMTIYYVLCSMDRTINNPRIIVFHRRSGKNGNMKVQRKLNGVGC